MNTMKEHMTQQIESLFWKIATEKEDIKMDGVSGYNEKAQFVGGKVLNLGCYVVLELLKDKENQAEGMNALRDIARMISFMPMETWGILNGITGLRRLQLAGILESAIDEETLERLKKSMDWRTFVDVNNNYALISKPTNYYGVAFGIARYRELLGWEPERNSQILLEHLMNHIKTYSGEYCFMDETKGDGRFDRYSILIPSEVASLLLAGGMEVPEFIRKMLLNSAHIFLKLANEQGLGYAYGRSIGAYGETAALEVLSAAAELGLFTEEEKKLAYGYTMRLVRTIVEFWYDKEMQSINMWDKGRRTDSYRNKNRILGENISLRMQVINSLEHWNRAGMTTLEEPEGWETEIGKQERCSLIRFAGGEYERGLVIVHEGKNIWSLPLINGGDRYYDKDPYITGIFQNLVIEGVSGQSHGSMVPRIILEDGRCLMPLSFFKSIQAEQIGEVYTVTCRQDELCILGESQPQKAPKASVVTTFQFKEGQISRKDVFCLGADWKVKEIRLTFLCFSETPSVEENCVTFASGRITSMEADGYETCQAEAIHEEDIYDAPHGRLKSRAYWSQTAIANSSDIRVSWTMKTNGN